MDPDGFAGWVNGQSWVTAKTMPDIPHEYTVVFWRDVEAARAAGRFIRSVGYRARWRRQVKPYYDHGPHRYWIIWPVINRCLRTEHGGHPNNEVERLPEQGQLEL